MSRIIMWRFYDYLLYDFVVNILLIILLLAVQDVPLNAEYLVHHDTKDYLIIWK